MTTSLLGEVFKPLARFFEVKMKVLDKRGPLLAELNSLLEQLKTARTPQDLVAYEADIERLERELEKAEAPQAFKTKAHQDAWLGVADYADEWYRVEKGGKVVQALRTYYFCNSGPSEPQWRCMTVTLSKFWARTPLRASLAGLCCVAGRLAKGTCGPVVQWHALLPTRRQLPGSVLSCRVAASRAAGGTRTPPPPSRGGTARCAARRTRQGWGCSWRSCPPRVTSS
jgi:hypothetical protein